MEDPNPVPKLVFPNLNPEPDRGRDAPEDMLLLTGGSGGFVAAVD